MNLAFLVGAAISIYILNLLRRLLKNYREAKDAGFHIALCPVPPNLVLWQLFSPAIQSVLKRYAPTSAYMMIRRATYGWEFREKEAGRNFTPPGFVLVNPGKNEYWVEDLEVINAILTRWRDFPQSPMVGGEGFVFPLISIFADSTRKVLWVFLEITC